MGAPGIHVSPRLLAGSIVPGKSVVVVGSPVIGVYRAGIPQVVLDPNDGDSIDVRIIRGNGDLTRPSNVPWTVAGTGPSPLLRTDFVGGQFPSGVAPFLAGDTEFPVQLNFAAGQPPTVARTGVLVLGTPDWGTLDPARPQGDLLLPHVLPPDEDLSNWQTAWIDPATTVLDSWVLWGGTAAGAAVGYSGGALRVYPGPDPSAATQRVALWNRTPLPGADWRLSFTYARADTIAPLFVLPPTGSPYPDSTTYQRLSLGGSAASYGVGADQWVGTHLPSGNLLAAWGDGNGWLSGASRSALGVTEVAGLPSAMLTGTDRYAGGTLPNRKPNALLHIGGSTLLMWHVGDTLDGRVGTYTAVSTDNGQTFTFSEAGANKIFSTTAVPPLQVVGVVQAGAGYGDPVPGLDRNYAYLYLNNSGNLANPFTGTNGKVWMARVKIAGTGGSVANISNPSKYSFFNGLDGSGNPTWTADGGSLDLIKYVYNDPIGMGKHFRCDWSAANSRFFAAVTPTASKLAVYESLSPWGGWGTLYYGAGSDPQWTNIFSAQVPGKWATTSRLWFTVSGNPPDSLEVQSAALVPVPPPPPPGGGVATTLLLGCAGVGAYPAGILSYVGADTTTPSRAHLLVDLDGLLLDIDNLHGPDDGRHVLYDLPGGARITPASDPDFVFTPPTLYDVAVEKVGGALTVKWRPQGGAWEDYTVAVGVHAGLQWGLFVAPNRDASFSGLTVSSYLGDTSRLLPFDPTPRYDDYLDTPPVAAAETRTVSTVAQLLSAHDTVAPNGHIVVADGVVLSTDFDLARSLPPGTRVVVRANSPQGATLACNVRILGDGWELRDFKEAPRAGAAARIRVIDADRVRVSRIDCTGQTGAFAVVTVEGDRPCSDIRIDRLTIQGHTTWGLAILATADKNVQLDWNEIPGSLLTTVGGGVLVGADSQANGLVLVKVAAFNRIANIRGPYAFLVRASGGVYFRNSLSRGTTGCDLAADNGTDNFYVSNDLTGGSRLLVRGLVPVILGNKSRGAGKTNAACVLYGGDYDPVSDGFEPGFPTQAQLQALTGVAGIIPREACSGALLASNDFEGTISVGVNAVADAVRPRPARNTNVFDHTGDGLASAGATWDVGTQYRPAAARPAGITVPPTFPLAAGNAGVSQDDSILNVIIITNPGDGDPIAPWWKIPGGNRSGKLWNRGPGLTFASSAWTPTMGPYDVTTGASHRSETTMNEVIGGPVSPDVTDYDNVAKIQNGSQLDWGSTSIGGAASDAVNGKTWLIWVPDTNPTGGPFDTSNGPSNNTFHTWASPGPHDDMWYAMGRRARAVMLSYGLQPWQLMLRINHEMVQSNNYQIYYATGPDYAKAMGRFIDGFRRGYSAHNADDYARMIFSPSRHLDCGPLERFFTCDPVALTTPYDLVDVSAHPASTMDSYAGSTLAVQTQEVAVWMAGGHDNARPTSDLPGSPPAANYAQNSSVADHSMVKLAKKYRIGMCNSEWSPRYDQGGCQVAPGVYQAMHDWFTQNAAWYAFECVFHSNTLQDLPAITNWAAGKRLFISLWTGDPAETSPAPAGSNPGAIHTGQLTLSSGGAGGGGANRSGLSWPSGMCDDSSLAGMMAQLHDWEAARSRLCDVSTQFFGRQHTSWTQLTDNFLLKPAGLVASLIAEGIMPALTIAHFSSAMPGLSVAAAANGDYDAYHLAAAQKIAALGVKVIIRLGHECDDDGNVYSYYHSGVTVADYKAMFRRHSLIYKGAIGPDCRIEWNHLRQAGQASGHDDDPNTFYPGDDVVDIIGADCYGNSPRGNPAAYIVTDTDWLAYLNNLSPNGHPQGPGTWLAYAVSKGKQFGVAEWGVTNWMGPGTVADSARYIRGMYEFFRDNAANIAYESYFNRIAGTAAGSGGHKLLPAVDNPNASAQYMTSWAQVLAGSAFTFGADYSANYNIKKGNASQSLVSQPASDTVILTAGADNTKQAALYLLCKQRPAVSNGTWSFYYTRLDTNIHTDALGIGTHFIASYVGSGGTIPANPSTWSSTIYRPVSGEPCGDSILAQDGDGLRIGFDEVNEPSPNLSNVLDAVAYQRSLTRPSLTLPAKQVNLANLAPGVEWLVTVVLSGQTIDFRATCPGQPAIHVAFNDPLIATKAGGWFGFRLDRGRSCQLRALTYLPG